jgi:hypothetical protein
LCWELFAAQQMNFGRDNNWKFGDRHLQSHLRANSHLQFGFCEPLNQPQDTIAVTILIAWYIATSMSLDKVLES